MNITIYDRQTMYPIYRGYASRKYIATLQQDMGFVIEPIEDEEEI